MTTRRQAVSAATMGLACRVISVSGMEAGVFGFVCV